MNYDSHWVSAADKRNVIDFWWDAQEGLCCICRHPMVYPKPVIGRKPKFFQRQPDEATIEHVVPKRAGGKNRVGDVRLAHRQCNSEDGGRWEKQRQAHRDWLCAKAVAEAIGVPFAREAPWRPEDHLVTNVRIDNG